MAETVIGELLRQLGLVQSAPSHPAQPMGQAQVPLDTGVYGKPQPEAYLGIRGDAGPPQGVQVADASGAVPASAMPEDPAITAAKAAYAAEQGGGEDPAITAAKRAFAQEQAAGAVPTSPAGVPSVQLPPPVPNDPMSAFSPSGGAGAAPPPSSFDFAREAKIGSQAGLSGVGHLLGAPLDLPTGLANLVVGGLNQTLGRLTGHQAPLPFSPESPLGMDAPHLGDRIATGASQVATAIDPNLAPIDQKDMSPGERVGYQTVDFATQAALQGGLMALLGKLRGASDIPRAFDSLIKPYEQPGAIGRDLAVGAGAGTGVGAYNETVPEDQRGIMGTIASMLAGGVGGGLIKDLLAGGGSKIGQVIKNLAPSNIPYDKNGMPTLGKTADDAAKYLEGAAGGKAAKADAGVALEKERALAELEGRPVAPLGQATQNLGLARAERGSMSSAEGSPGITERNLDIGRWAGKKVQDIGPGVDPTILPGVAERVGQEQIGEARGGVTSAQNAADAEAARQATEAQQLATRYSRPDQAAQRLDTAVVDQNLRPITERSNAMYDAADPQGASMVPTDNLIAEAQAVRDSLGNLNTPDKVIPQGLLARINRTQPDAVETPAPPNSAQQNATMRRQQFDEIATRGGPDANFREMMSSGARDTLRRGETYRSRAENFVNGLERDAARTAPPPTVTQEPAQTSVRSLVAVVPEISSTITRAVKAQNYTLADNLRALRTRIQTTLDDAANNGNAEAAQAVAARQNYEQTVAPVYGRGPGDEATKLRKDFNLDRNNRTTTPPSQTEGRFIQQGQPEKMQSLQRAGGEPAMREARAIVVSKAIDSGLVRDGRLNGQALGKFTKDWASVIDTDPALRREFDQLTGQVARGETASGALAEQLTRAQGHLQMTEEDIGASALSMIAGKDAQHAVAAIAGSGDPEKAMADLARRVGGTPGAGDALKQATTDWLYRKVTNTGREGDLPPSYAKVVAEAENPSHLKMLAAAGFTPDDMASLARVRRTLDLRKILDDAKGPAGSPTAANFDEQMKLFEAGMRGWFGGFRGGNMARNLKVVLGMKNNNDVARLKELVARAMVDPRVAKALLDRKVMDNPSAWGSKISKLMRWEQVAHRMNNDEQPSKK